MRTMAALTSVVSLLALVAALGTTVAGAQAEPTGYSIVDEWTSVASDYDVRPAPWPAGHVPGGLATGSDTLVVTDRTAHTVRVYEPDGTFVRAIGGPGTEPGQFARPRDVALMPDGTLAVSDTGNDRVQIVTAAGEPVRAWTVPEPQGVTVIDRPENTRVYVVSSAEPALMVYDVDGSILETLEIEAATRPEGLVHMADTHGATATRVGGVFYVIDTPTGEVHRVNELTDSVNAQFQVDGLTALGTDGPTVVLFGIDEVGVTRPEAFSKAVPFKRVADVELDATGIVWAAAEPEGLVSLGHAPQLYQTLSDPTGQLVSPEHVAAGDEVMIADSLARVQAWHRDGTPAVNISFDGPEAHLLGIDFGSAPADVAAAGENRYLLIDGRIGRFEDEALSAIQWKIAGAGQYPVAISAHGDRLAAVDLPWQEVRLLDRTLAEVARWSLAGGGFRGVTDVALTADHVFLANQGTSDLEIWSADGALLRTVRVASGPMRVAAGPDGDAFVLAGSGWIFRYGADGSPLGAWPAGPVTGKPVDIAVDEDGRVYVADAGDVIRVHAPDPDAPSQLPPPAGDHFCSALRDKGAEPQKIVLGETVEVHLVVDGVCPVEYKTADVVLVLDVSGSMDSDNKIESARDAALAFVARMDPLLTRIGLVAFNDQAYVKYPLTSDQANVVRTITALRADGGTDLVDGLQRGSMVLNTAEPRPGATKVIVFMSDGRHTDPVPTSNPPGLDDLLEALRQQGIQVYTVALGADADRDTLARMATDPSHVFDSPTPAELRSIYVEIARRIEAAELFKIATVTDVLPGNMTFVSGSGLPIEPQVSPDGRVLTWRLTNVLEPGFRLSYHVRPEAVGLWPTNVEARNEYVDGLDNPGELVFPVPQVRVIAPTPTPSPTASATPTPTVTPTSTPTPPRYDAYLPLAIREHCDATWLHVTLVIDTSSSMRAPFAAGGAVTKIEAARAAARAFLAEVDLDRDSLGLVQFDAAAAVVASGRDRAALEAAIDGLETHRGTRIDLGLLAARADVETAARQPGGRHVVVLMSDGIPEPGTADGARSAAAVLREAGVTLFTVAIGADADRGFLTEIADSPGRAYEASDGASLVGIYERVAARLDPCVPSWRREG